MPVYAHDTTAGDKRARAVELLERLAQDRAFALSVQLQEFFVTINRWLPNRWSEDLATGRRYDGVEIRNRFLA